MRTGDVGFDRNDAPGPRQPVRGEGLYGQFLLQLFLDEQVRPAILGIERCIDLQTIEIVVLELDLDRAPSTRSAHVENAPRIF